MRKTVYLNRFFFALVLSISINGYAENSKPKESKSSVTRSRVNDLKLEVLNSKAQMRILKHLIRNEGVSKTYPKIRISFDSEMGSRYKLHSVNYDIDGESVFTYFRDEDQQAENSEAQKVQEYSGSLSPGSHTLTIRVVFQGNDSGVFSYISDYKTKVEGRMALQVKKGTTTAINVKAYERGWILTEFKDRPDLKVTVNGSEGKFTRY